MTDFAAVARARGLDFDPLQTERYAQVLSSLEAKMDELKRDLPTDMEPSPRFEAVSGGAA